MAFTTPPTFPGSYQILSTDLNSYLTNDLVWLNTAHGAKIYRNAALTISSSVLTTVGFDGSLDDTDTYHSNVTNNSRITIPTGLAGVYQVTGTVAWVANLNGFRQVQAFVNGTLWAQSTVPSISSGGSTRMAHDFAFTRRFAVADYIEIQVLQNSGGGLALGVGGESQTWMAAYLVGA